MGRSRGGLTTKIHAVTDARGLPIRLAITAGETHDAIPAKELLSGLQKGQIILADKAYDADWIRRQIEDQGATPNIPSKANRRSEEHTSELQSLMRNSYAVFCLQKKNITTDTS